MNWLVTSIVLVAICFGLGAFFGAPWVPAFKQDIDELLDLAQVGKGTRFIDLGCGDGKLLLAAAERGAIVTGYEINPIMWFIAWLRLMPYHSQSKIRLGSYWGQSLQVYDVIWLYLIDHHMSRMAYHLQRQARPDTRIVSYIFAFPNIKPTKVTRNSFLYTGRSFGKLKK